MWQNIEDLYNRAGVECTIPIQFRHNSNGEQQNNRRDELLLFIQQPTIERARDIAAALQLATTERSHLGLFFLLVGGEPPTLVLARFPASEGIVAQEHGEGLKVDFVEQIFLKSLHAYKSVHYQGPFLQNAFWQGRAIDKQLKRLGSSPNYWIQEFLMSELLLTSTAGTKRLALALKKSIHEAVDDVVKSELLTFAQLVRHHDGDVIAPIELAEQAGLSEASTAALSQAFPRPELGHDAFEVSQVEFDNYVGFRLIQLDNGARLMAPDDAFDEVFLREPVTGAGTRFSTTGQVISRELRKEI